jgi:oxaloacetate decarboxylase gamma subunit
MDAALLRQGLDLMLVGMGSVFAFLTLLVLATAMMSRLVLRLQDSPADTGVRALPPDRERDCNEVAAIAAAIEVHRRR